MDREHIELAKNMDWCRMERRFTDLSPCVANDLVVAVPGGKNRMVGIDAPVESDGNL